MWRSCGIVLLSLMLATPDAWPRDQHFSFWSDNPQPFLDAIKNSPGKALPTLPAGDRVCGGIVTHHFLASGLMVRFFAGLRGQPSPETIILLGPNHFHQGLADISISSLPWKTPFGVLQTDRQLVRQITKAIQLPEDTEAFTGEHSVGVLIPFLKYYFPQSRVVPVLIDVNADTKRLHQLRDVLSARMMNPKTLLLLSMDFSHDSVAAIADARDEQAQAVISSMDASKTEGLWVDCRKGLWLLLESLKGPGCDRVQINEHTNSAQLTGKPDQPNVTSYFTIYFLNVPARAS
jgi:AmmeMemoRadiSam system protein B